MFLPDQILLLNTIDCPLIIKTHCLLSVVSPKMLCFFAEHKLNRKKTDSKSHDPVVLPLWPLLRGSHFLCCWALPALPALEWNLEAEVDRQLSRVPLSKMLLYWSPIQYHWPLRTSLPTPVSFYSQKKIQARDSVGVPWQRAKAWRMAERLFWCPLEPAAVGVLTATQAELLCLSFLFPHQ